MARQVEPVVLGFHLHAHRHDQAGGAREKECQHARPQAATFTPNA